MKIIIMDDHTMVLRGLEALLNYQADIEIVGTASNGEDAYQLAKELQPDMALLDISAPPGESGMVTAARIHADFPQIKIIMLTMYDDREYLLYTIENGASGFLLKNSSEEVLLEAIRTVYNGGVYISKEMVPYLVQGFVHRHTEETNSYLNLSEREVEVLILIAKGYGNKEISDKLFISVKTVESYKTKIMLKLGVKTRPELVEYALKKKLLQF
ncbi:MAG: response regulator transcription factor [Clostridium sp.]|nr:response regulator transcription factor [Clostridium sp.]